MKTKTLKIGEIKPYDKNPRKNDSAVDAVAESIKQCTYISPIVVDGNYVILAGHTRWKALKKLGYKEVEVIVKEGLTEEQKKKFRILDNKTNEFADWDYDLLMEELTDLDFEGFDFGFGEKPETTDGVEEVDIPEFIKEPRAKLGEVYQLGNHRLMCGDSTKKEDIEKLIGGGSIDLLFTDPPYNVDIKNSLGMKIENDNLETKEFIEFINKCFKNASEHLRPGGAFYVWHADSNSTIFREACERNNMSVKQCLIWVKNGINFGRQDYKWKHEPCLYGWKEGAAHYFVEEFNHPTVIEDRLDVNKLKKEEMKEIIEKMMRDQFPSTIIHENKPLKNDLHPTMKPLKMCADLIRHSSRKGWKVLDIFGGSGSTLMVCEQMDRICYTMEYDPYYADVIIERWEEYTGKKAVKIND